MKLKFGAPIVFAVALWVVALDASLDSTVDRSGADGAAAASGPLDTLAPDPATVSAPERAAAFQGGRALPVMAETPWLPWDPTAGLTELSSYVLPHLDPDASPGEVWREVKLTQASAVHAVEVAEYARRYGIGRGLSRQIYEAARAERVHPAIAFGLVRVESSFNPRALGPGGIGLTQISASTARALAPGVSAGDLYSPRLNLALGFRYLRQLLVRFDHDVTLALIAYNRGPTHVSQLLARGHSPRDTFARKVLRDVEPESAAAL